jgi:PAS domain S-box-containing protein
MMMRDLELDERVPVMAWTARPDMSCESLSRQWLAFTGYSAEQALGDGWSRGVHPEDLARWLDICVRAFDSREPFEIEYRLRRRDGEFRWMLDRGVPRYSRDGQFLGYAGACIDIDERKRAERELERALERERKLRLAAEEASRLKDHFLGAALREAIDGGGPVQLRRVLAGVRVLVVDADARSRERMAKVLGLAGAEAKTAARAAEPLGAWRPDVVISDIGLSGGSLLVKALRAPAGRDAQLTRPVEPLALLAMVARAVQPAGM